MMKLLAVVLVAALLPYYVNATSIIVTGPVNGIWAYDTVLVQGNIFIPAGSELNIAPGTLIRFLSYYRFDVHGSLKAQGAVNDSIVFTINDTTGFYNQAHGRGGWSGIRFRSLATTEDSSILSYCKLQFGKATEDSVNSYGGALLAFEFHKLRISNCKFYNNYSFYSGGAIFLQNSNSIIENCNFTGNISGNTGVIYGYGGGICAMYSAPVVKGCKFYYNRSTGVGGACSFDNSNALLENNIMKFNTSALGGGLGILRSSPYHTISNNLLSDNQALFFGGGICCIRSFPVFSNLTIVNNSSIYGGGFYCNDSAAPSMYNSIIWGNEGFGASVYIWDIYSAPNFYYCNIEGDTTGFEGSGSQMGYIGQYQNNINQSPEFLGTGMYPYQLSANSPCIDVGTPDESFLNLPPTDLLGEDRVTNGQIDLGVFEYNSSTQLISLEKTENLVFYPNPFREITTITIPFNDQNIKSIRILDSRGRVIKKRLFDLHKSNISWDGSDDCGNKVSSGLYFIQIITSKKSYTGKLLKD